MVSVPSRLADREPLGRALPRRGRDRDDRPLLAAPSQPAPDAGTGVRKIVHVRWKKRLGPVQLAAMFALAPSTVHRILTASRVSRLSHIDRATGEPVRRYEHPHPGDPVHVDVKKLGNIADRGGWRYLGRDQGRRNRAATPGKPRNVYRNPKMGTCHLHSVLDDHSRVVYTETWDDQTAVTAVAVMRRALRGSPPAM